MMQEFVDSINKATRKILGEIHTAIPAVITDFDTDTMLATVQPKAKFKQPNGKTIDYPSISGVPVVFPQSQNVTIAFPIKADDNCLLVFGEKSLDYWLYGKETDTELSFDLSNAIAIPSLSTEANDAMKTACKEDAAVIKVCDTILKIKDDAVHISGDLIVEGNIKASDDLKVDGKVTVSKDIKTSGDVFANESVSLTKHTHTDSMGGISTIPH